MDKQMFQYLGDFVFVISPIIGYIPQIVTNNIVFSPILSLILMVSALMKFFYWKENRFSNLILAQSGFLIFTHLILVYNFKHKLGIIESKIYESAKFKKIYKKYGIVGINILFATIVFSTVNFITFLTLPSIIYKLCGYVSLILESSVGLIQMYIKRIDKKFIIKDREEKRRLPKELFLSWIIGDFAKLYWMYTMPSPWLLTVPIIFQIVIDFFLMFE